MRSVAVRSVSRLTKQAARARLLVKETGSLPLESGSAEAFDETVVIAQMKGESAESFAQRSLDRFATLGRSGRQLGSVTLQVGTAHDAATCALRRSVLLALLENLALVSGASEVLLEAPSSLGAEEQQALLSLVDDLLQLPQCATLAVRLRFRDAPEATPEIDSGVFWLAPTR